MRKYLVSCGLLLIPVFIVNITLSAYLPPPISSAELWGDIPPVLRMAENIFRLLVFVLPFLMPLNINTVEMKTALLIFITGNILYFASWLLLILAPDSGWSQSAIGFLAPAYTPAIWFAGLALLGRKIYWGSFYRWWMYLVIAGLFLIMHVSHALIIYTHNY